MLIVKHGGKETVRVRKKQIVRSASRKSHDDDDDDDEDDDDDDDDDGDAGHVDDASQA